METNNFDLTKQNQLLFEISSSLLKIDSLETVLNRAVREIIKAANAHTVSIALFDKETEKLLIESIIKNNNERRVANKGEFRLGEGIAGTAAKEKRIIQECNLNKSEIFVGESKNLNFGIICVPMIFHKELVGVISISTIKNLPLTKDEQDFLTVLATMISSAVVNSQLYEQSRHEILREKELIKTKNDLISTATHELRTPLTTIKGYLDMVLALDSGPILPLQEKYLKRAYNSTERLSSLVEDLLLTLKIDEEKIDLNISDFHINKVISEAITNLSQKAKKKEIGVEYKDKPVTVHADQVKTKHVVENLLDNAIKYTKKSGTVKIVVANRTDDVLVSVSDTGVGIAEKYLNTIFGRFQRIDNPLSIEAGGTGLGLYIVKKLVEKQGGRVMVESELQHGSTFSFTLPK